MKNANKPTQGYYFDPYSAQIEEAIDDLKKYLDDSEARKILIRIIDEVYKSGFNDGLDFIKWLNS